MMVFLPRVRPENLRQRVLSVVGERNPFSSPHRLAAVEKYIEQEFKSFGLTVESDVFSFRGKSFRNIIARPGSSVEPSSSGRRRQGEGLMIVGAHLDSVGGSPGADDNASGVAVLLETARALSKSRRRAEVVFCAFNLEELNMLGSTHFAEKLKRAGTKVQGMISLEMVGFTDPRPGKQNYPLGLRWLYPDRGDFIGLIGNLRSSALLRRFAAAMRRVPGLPVETLRVLGNGFMLPEARLSDHSPFWDRGYPALLVTDTAFLRNPNYHAPSDTAETLDFEFMARVCQGVAIGLESF
ncbi:MAG: M28 family peptidase [Deltaproteobacteria bacterium]|nr:M28 family peptidase [Deltaproteobacteria bacterium]